MKRIVLVLISVLIITSLSQGQSKSKTVLSKDKTVATIGKNKITTDEFSVRYELMPHISKNQDLPDSVKNEFLYSIIAEKLWAMEASEKGYDTTDIIRYSMNSLEKLYVKDALYKEEISKKVNVSPEEIIRGMARSAWKLYVNAISSADSSGIFEIHRSLKNGAGFDSLLQMRPEYADQKTPIEVVYGQLPDDFAEDTLYTMKAGTFSSPVKTSTGWFIFLLKNKVTNPSDNSTSDRTKKVKQIIRSRKEKKLELKYLEDYFTWLKVTTSGPLFWSIVEKSAPVLIEKASKPENKKGNVNLDEKDVAEMIKQFGTDSLNMAFIRFEKDPVTLRDFLYSFVTDGFTVHAPTFELVAAKIRTYVNNYIENEMLSREGYRRGLQNLPDVKRDMQWWKENYTAHLLKNQFLDSARVSDDEVLDYYRKTKTGQAITEVKVIEILTKKLEDIETIMNELQKGKDFKELARLYNTRETTKDKDGDMGYFPVTMYGEIGKMAERMKTGQVYGPLTVPEGYSIFKLVDKKEHRDSLSKPFEEIKDQLKEDLFSQKLNKAFDKYTAKLAGKYGVKVNSDVLKAIPVNKINMFTSRYMGFGGRIAAIPYTAPFFEWVKEWKKNRKLNP